MRDLDKQYEGFMEFIIIMIMVGAFIGGCTVGEHGSERQYQSEAIKRGHAEYNATTGEWQWKGEKQEVTE